MSFHDHASEGAAVGAAEEEEDDDEAEEEEEEEEEEAIFAAEGPLAAKAEDGVDPTVATEALRF